MLMQYSWPGNVRELENTLERAVILAPADRIRPLDLPTDLSGAQPSASPMGMIPLAEVERRHILQVLKELGGRRGEAARLLGISRRTLYRKLLEWEAAGPAEEGDEDEEGEDEY